MGLLEDLMTFIKENPVIVLASFFFAIIGFVTSIIKIYEFFSGRKKEEQERIVYEYAKKQIEEKGKLEQLEESKRTLLRSLRRKKAEVRKLEEKKTAVISSLEAQPRFMEIRMMEKERDILNNEIITRYKHLREIEEKLAMQPSLPLELRKAVEATIVKPYMISSKKEQTKSVMIFLSYFYGFARIWLSAMRVDPKILDIAFSITSAALVFRYVALTISSKPISTEYFGYLLPILHEGKIWGAITIWRKRKRSALHSLFTSGESPESGDYRYILVNPRRALGKVLPIHKPSIISKEIVAKAASNIQLPDEKKKILSEIITTIDDEFLDKILDNLKNSIDKNPDSVHEVISKMSQENGMMFIAEFYDDFRRLGPKWHLFLDYRPVILE